MGRFLIPFIMLAALCAGPFVAAGQDMADTGSGILAPTPARVAVWTNKLGYVTGDEMSVYLTTDPMGDETEYAAFIYRENIETGARAYIDATEGSSVLREDVTDAAGLGPGAWEASAIGSITQRRIWAGSVPEPGLWQIVAEYRSPDVTQVVKRAYAKFVVSADAATEIGADGTDTEITTDTTWNNDTIYKVYHQVFVNSGATLTIEPGTLIQARGQNAVIVVERGGKIMAEGTRRAPIVMTCDAEVGLRDSGCWAGLIMLGNASMTRGTGLAEGVIPETRPAYGGDDDTESSGVLRYVRVEFAGVDFNPETQPNAFGFHGIGSGTVIDHIQAHEGEDDGIEFFGGTAGCRYCVSSGSKDDSLDWAFGWRGKAQYLFIHQDPNGDNGIEADNDSLGFDRTPRSAPQLYNVTMVGGLFQDDNSTSGDGMRIRVGTQIDARNVILMGFGGEALDVRDNSTAFFEQGTSSLQSAIITGNGALEGDAQIRGVAAEHIGYVDVDPQLVNVRYEANPDPRPMVGSEALVFYNATSGAGAGFDAEAHCIGAFCNGENWLEEWTFFGDEADYDAQ